MRPAHLLLVCLVANAVAGERLPNGTHTDWVANPFSSSSSGRVFKAERIRTFGSQLPAVPEATPRRQAPPSCSNWAVITSIFPPTDLIRQLASLRDWCTVVVGDRKSPAVYDANVTFLAPSDQEILGLATSEHLPWNHFGRKNIGFLYAILHGAVNVYDTDDDNRLQTSAALDDALTQTSTKLVSCASRVCNPYPYFRPALGENTTHAENMTHLGGGTVFSWPRGFPLPSIRDHTSSSLLPAAEDRSPTVAVVQSLADGDPDVDAIYRLTRHIPFVFTRRETQVAFAPGTYVPFNAQATLFKRDALWATLLPVTVHGRVTDIWRSLIICRLFADLQLSVAFSSSWVTQIRNAHNYLGDFESETDLYLKSGALIELLAAWSPEPDTSVPQRFMQLYIHLYEHGILEEDDVHLANAWLRDLARASYRFPPLVP